MGRGQVDRTVLEVDDDPVKTGTGHDLHGLRARDGRDRAEGGAALAPFLAQTVEGGGGGRCGHQGTPGQAGTLPPKNGVSAWDSVCGRFDVKIISAPLWSASWPGGLSRSETRRAMAGAGSIQSTGHGASRTRRSSSSG